MRLGYGSFTTGRWWLYLDTGHLTIGRTTSDDSVIYSLLGIVVEHLRPIGHRSERAIAQHRRQIKKWQQTRNMLWRNSLWQIPQREDETPTEYARRRWQHVSNGYEARAGDARALGKDVPTLAELASWAPRGIPAAAYSSN